MLPLSRDPVPARLPVRGAALDPVQCRLGVRLLTRSVGPPNEPAPWSLEPMGPPGAHIVPRRCSRSGGPAATPCESRGEAATGAFVVWDRGGRTSVGLVRLSSRPVTGGPPWPFDRVTCRPSRLTQRGPSPPRAASRGGRRSSEARYGKRRVRRCSWTHARPSVQYSDPIRSSSSRPPSPLPFIEPRFGGLDRHTLASQGVSDGHAAGREDALGVGASCHRSRVCEPTAT